MIFIIEIPVVICSWIPVFNAPINLILMGFIMFFNWRIDVALDSTIVEPYVEPEPFVPKDLAFETDQMKENEENEKNAQK